MQGKQREARELVSSSAYVDDGVHKTGASERCGACALDSSRTKICVPLRWVYAVLRNPWVCIRCWARWVP